MSTIEYTQRLLNAGKLTERDLGDILAGRVSEHELRERGGKVQPDSHPARTAVIAAARIVPEVQQETRLYADYTELFKASLARFMNLNAVIMPYPVPLKEVENEEGSWAVAQHISGDVNMVNGILARAAVFRALATRYGGEDFEEVDDETIDTVEEFLNVINGLFIVHLANRKQEPHVEIEPDLDLPLAARDVVPRGSHQLVLRIYTEAGDFLLVLSTDAFL